MNEIRETEIRVPDRLPPLAELGQKEKSAGKSHRGKWLLLAVSAQVLMLSAFANNFATTYAMGQTVKMKATLYDPRDPLKGEYVQLSYPELQNRKELETKEFQANHPAYIVLKRGDDVWSVDRMVTTKPTVSANEAYIKADVIAPYAYGNYKTLDLSFDKFYVPEGKGTIQSNDLAVELAVDQDGRAIPKHLFVDGKQRF